MIIDSVTLNDIKCVIPRLSQDCHMTNWDLKGMYHQVYLKPSCSEYFGFAVLDVFGVLTYYKYIRLPFGTATAVFITDALIKPIKFFCHRLGIDISIYIDDGITIELTYFKCLTSTYFVISILLLAGWSLQITKCNLTPVRNLQYLGYCLDTCKMLISLPVTKIEKVFVFIDKICDAFHSNTLFPVKIIASFLGLLAHSYYSHGPFVRFVSRNSNHTVGQIVTQYGWDSNCYITSDMFNEISLCKTYFPLLNGMPIRQEQKEFQILTPHQTSLLACEIDPRDVNLPYHVFISGIFNCIHDFGIIKIYTFKCIILEYD